MGGWLGTTRRSEGTRRDSRGVIPEGAREAAGTAGPQMMVGTLPPLLFRLLFFLDRLGVAMSTKRSSGQPYCTSVSTHSWLLACRAYASALLPWASRAMMSTPY